MSRMFSLRDWFYIEDASKHLTARFNEQVTARDIYALALEGRITLSLRFENAIAARTAELLDAPTGTWKEDYISVGQDEVHLRLSHTVDYFHGVFDIPFFGSSPALLREMEWHGDIDKAEFMSFDEIVLTDANGKHVVLVDRDESMEDDIQAYNHWSAFRFLYGLPDDARFVVKTSAMLRLEGAAETDKPLQSKERANLLSIVGALLEQLDTKEAALISALTERHPTVAGLKKRNLEDVFAEAKRRLKAN